MPQWSRAELAQAVAEHERRVEAIRASGDWAKYGYLYTEDAVYVEHCYGTFRGREEIRPWIVSTMTAFPATSMTGFAANWVVIDEDNDRVIAEIDNPMTDPGDGSVISPTNLSILTYAGNGQWSRQEDVYNPLRFFAAAKKWVAIATQHGRLTPDAEAWVKEYGG